MPECVASNWLASSAPHRLPFRMSSDETHGSTNGRTTGNQRGAGLRTRLSPSIRFSTFDAAPGHGGRWSGCSMRTGIGRNA
jgi:hypothetical protein